MTTADEKFMDLKAKADLMFKAEKLIGAGDYIFDSKRIDKNKPWYRFVGFREVKYQLSEGEIKYYLIGILKSKEGIEQEMALQLIVEYFENRKVSFNLDSN
jgi:hypothetical protein